MVQRFESIFSRNLHDCHQQGEGESAAARAAEARRRCMARRKAKEQQIRGAQLRLGSPPPVPGRRHEPVQTDLYLEEIWMDPPKIDMCTQTDLFLDRPVSPYYVPAKTGADVATQIYPGDVRLYLIFLYCLNQSFQKVLKNNFVTI